MFALHEQLAHRITAWRTREYETADYPAIGEILEWASGTDEGGNTRFLRTAQLRALETYWYLRLVEKTPKIPALYARLFEQPADLLSALGLTDPRLTRIALNSGSAALLTRVRDDDELVREFKLQALRETLNLDYPSYILALAMGAGKTLLIGAIIASEFAMALEYPDGPFVENALVFAPGKTILESLRELLAAPYHAILPPRLHKPFAASVSDVPERKADFVAGRYELDAPDAKTTVAVKITDMLGEEVLVTRTV